MQLTEATEIARTRGWLASCPPVVQRDLIREMRLIELAGDQYLWHATDEPGGIYCVVNGTIKATAYSPVRGETLAHLVSPFVWFGQTPAILRTPRSMGFRASGPAELLHITLADLDRVTRLSVDHMRVLATLSELGMREVLAVVSTLLIPSPTKRIAATLIRVAYGAVGPKPGESVSIMLTQSELGEMANTSRNLTGRTLKEMERKGWISIGYRTLKIIYPERIEAFGADDPEAAQILAG